MNKDMNENDLFGQLRIRNKHFSYEKGILRKSLEDGNVFFADEANIARE
jgi:hypothetical protein